MTKEMKPREVMQVYGVPGSTLRMKRKAVEQVVGKTPDKKRAKDAVQGSIKKLSPGPKPYLEDDEAELFLARADQISASGPPGRDNRKLMAEGRAWCNALADDEPDPAKAERLRHARCSYNWLNRLMHDKENNTVLAEGGTMRKQSLLSTACT